MFPDGPARTLLSGLLSSHHLVDSVQLFRVPSLHPGISWLFSGGIFTGVPCSVTPPGDTLPECGEQGCNPAGIFARGC